ncbi:Rha family transcriptional regulator [Castellaniella sp. MT123]|uniref:Rha family transcriptional regulator n=1 Tax=Castellaniella sp. MT123 TaxID=3140381 RepID=UPI0031F3762F
MKMGRDSGKSATPTTGKDSITLSGTAAEPRIDSRQLAQYLGNQHESVVKLLTAYADDFQELGVFRFQIGKPASAAGGRPERYALLNEDQAYLLLTYSRNTKRVRELKVLLVMAFREARQRVDLHSAEYLPTYHDLHDEIARLARNSGNARFVHLNVNRAINQTVGVESGSRKYLSVARQSILVVAQSIAAQAMAGAHGHHEGYQRAKAALQRLETALIGGAA